MPSRNTLTSVPPASMPPRPDRVGAPEPEKPRTRMIQSPSHVAAAFDGPKHTFDLIVPVARKRRYAVEVADSTRAKKARVNPGS